MLNKEHITLGDAVVIGSTAIYIDASLIANTVGIDTSTFEDTANAAFIAEALNVFNETGMTPRELLANNEELKREKLLTSAEHQLLGFHANEYGETIEGLLSAMDLTIDEWKALKSLKRLEFISDKMNSHIEAYFHINNY